MRAKLWCGAAAALLGGCGDGTVTQNNATEQVAESLRPGGYEVSAKVDALHSTDKTTPATKAKVGEALRGGQACVAADGSIAPDAFAESGDVCTRKSSYIRNGRLNVELNCKRSGQSGPVMVLVDGDFTADGFTAKVTSDSYFVGTGDYHLVRSVTGKWTGQCSAPVKEAAK
jgi:hypothetical protein